jgi:hypothetical protein
MIYLLVSYGNLAGDYRTGNGAKCHNRITGTVIFANYRINNISKRHDSITGSVTWPITIPVMIQSVTVALPVW